MNIKYSKAAENHLRKKERRRKQYKTSLKRKETDRLRCSPHQRTIDKMEYALKHKAKGRHHKVKGETMPTMFCANSRCAKSWKHLNRNRGGKVMRGESMKVACIWELT